MENALHYLISFIIFCPLVLLMVVFISAKKLNIPSAKAFGYGADGATVILFISVPLIIHSIWQTNVTLYFLVLFIMIAIVLCYKEWRGTKELVIKHFLKKLWRIYFLILVILYIAIFIVGLVHNVIKYSFS